MHSLFSLRSFTRRKKRTFSPDNLKKIGLIPESESNPYKKMNHSYFDDMEDESEKMDP